MPRRFSGDVPSPTPVHQERPRTVHISSTLLAYIPLTYLSMRAHTHWKGGKSNTAYRVVTMFERLKAKLRSLSAALYDLLIGAMTTRWYRQVLLECPMDATVLDVGIGTAHSLLENRDLVLSHRLQVVGVDMSRAYVDAGRKHVLDYGLSANVTMNHADIFDFNTEYKDKFDIIYFSGSFMIIPRNTEALVHCVKMLRSPIPKVPNGANIFFTLTFEKRTFVGMYVMPYVKKLLRLLTTVNFGEVTSEDQFRKVLTEANVDIVEVRIISDRYFRSEVVVMAKPRSKAE